MEKGNLSFLSDKEREQLEEIKTNLNNALHQREQSYTELDDMTYDAWYLSNKKAASGYVRPRKNRRDMRVVTGSTREKVNTIVAALLKYNFDFTIDAFDKESWPDRDVGYGLEGLVLKSRELEEPNYEKKRALFYSEFVPQGNAFIYEMSVEEEILYKEMSKKKVENIMDMKWTEERKFVKRAETDLVPGINVYLGNIREYYMEKQPFVGIRRELTRAEAKGLYGTWSRWKYADKPNTQVLEDLGEQEYNNWNMIESELDIVEEIRYFDKPNNVYQILVNGVPMLPDGFPLQYLLGVLRYPIVKVDGEPISRFFAYSRGISSKNKFNQALLDEFYRIIVLKFRNSTNPPLGNMTGRQLNLSTFESGTIHDNVDADKLKPIGPNAPVSGPEYNAFELVKRSIDESSVSPIFEGVRTPGEQTAQEINTLKTQALQKLGMIMVGIIQMEEEMVWLRTYNILKNWTEPMDVRLKDVKGQIKQTSEYLKESVEREFDDGKSGIHMIELKEDQIPDARSTFAEERLLKKKRGVEIRKTYLSVKELNALKFRLKIKVRPVEKDANELRSALFEESLMKAMNMFPDSINRPYWQRQWANYNRLDPRKAFVEGAPQTPPMGEELQPGAKTVGAQALPQISQQMKPALKRMQ